MRKTKILIKITMRTSKINLSCGVVTVKFFVTAKKNKINSLRTRLFSSNRARGYTNSSVICYRCGNPGVIRSKCLNCKSHESQTVYVKSLGFYQILTKKQESPNSTRQLLPIMSQNIGVKSSQFKSFVTRDCTQVYILKC